MLQTAAQIIYFNSIGYISTLLKPVPYNFNDSIFSKVDWCISDEWPVD